MVRALLLTLASAFAQTNPGATLTGHVVDTATGLPISGAQVMLMRLPAGAVQSAQTGPDGRFAFPELRAGPYSLQAAHPAYSGPLGLPQPAHRVTIGSNEEPPHTILRLVPGGALSGQVLADDGEPLAGCNVQLFPAPLGIAPIAAAAHTESDQDGEFHFHQLAPDRYLAAAVCPESIPVERLLGHTGPGPWPPAATWQPSYYAQSHTLRGATPIAVSSGSNPSVELRMTPTPISTVRGSFQIEPSQPSAVRLVPAGEPQDPLLQFRAALQGGDFEFHRVPPGTYQLSTASVRQRVEVGPAAPPPILVPPQAAFTVTGRILPPSEPPSPALPEGFRFVTEVGPNASPRQLPLGALQLSPVDLDPLASKHTGTISADDATFTISGVSPGTWRVSYQGYLAQAYVEALQYGVSAPEGDILRTTAGSAPPLVVKLSSAFPDLILDVDDHLVPDMALLSVYAVPEGAPAVAGNLQMTVPPGIPLRLGRLPPGRYRIFAIAHHGDLGVLSERLLELLRRQVTPLDAVAREQRTVPIRVFSAAEVHRLASAFISGEAQ